MAHLHPVHPGSHCFSTKEHLIEGKVGVGKKAFVGANLLPAHYEGDVRGEARGGEEEVGQVSCCHLAILFRAD